MDSNRRFEIWNGSAWGELEADWNISADRLGGFAAANYTRVNANFTITGLWTFSGSVTINAGTWNGTAIATNKGGTGQTTYTDGQILIGKTAGNTLEKATVTEGAGIDIVSGGGAITISAETSTATNPGIIEIATQAEVDAGSDPNRAVTPLTLAGTTAVKPFVTGTRMLFQQTAAPTGWTKEVSATYNNAALRLYTGTIATGGVNAFTSVFSTSRTTSTDAADLAAHTHGVSALRGKVAAGTGSGDTGVRGGASGNFTQVLSGNTDSAGAGGGHNHTMTNMNLKFVGTIIASIN
jgi:hypothetical protein